MVAGERGRVFDMKWQAALVGALASAALLTMACAPAAFADVHIVNDPGGEVSEYVKKFHELSESGERLVIDGPCLSACTLFTAFIAPDHVCVTRRAVLGFHAASYFDDAKRSLVPTRKGTDLVMRLYPPEIRSWIAQHGGLSTHILAMRGKDLSGFYKTCPEEAVGN
jgi:hypothetical protein